MTRRFTPADFGAPMGDAWVEPDDDLVDFLRDDPEVDWTNRWVRQGARDEMAGKPVSANPYASVDGPSLNREDWRGWRDGWMSSGNFHGFFDRAKHRAWRARMREWSRVQGLIDLGFFRERGQPDPPNEMPDYPSDLVQRRPKPDNTT